MDSTYLTKFSKSILTGLFAGILATLICLFYNIYYRNSTGFPLASMINVSSLIFGVNLLFFVIGIIFYGFIKLFRQGIILFMIVSVLITIFLCWEAGQVHRSDDSLLNTEFHHLLLAMTIIMGLFSSFGIPWLYKSKGFEEHVL